MLSWKQFYYSFDGGKNWILKKIIAPDSSNKFQILDILFLNQNKIIILNYDYDKKIRFTSITSDFGDTWEYYYLDTLKFQKMFFLDEMTGWGCGGHQIKPDSPTQKDVIVHTTDGGKTWHKQLDTLVIPSMGLNQIYFIDRDNGFAHGLGRKLWRTTNGGKKWTMDTSVNIRSIPWSTIDIAPVSHDLIFACSEYIGLIYKYSKTVSVDPENKDKNSIQEFSISPNPAGEYIEISGMNKGLQPLVPEQEIKIFNLLGECVMSAGGAGGTHPLIPSQEGNVRIDVSGLPAGVYFVRVGGWVGRFVKI